ncbi:FecR domain-containing protein [Butyrivibrio sp. WCE2006]|uniref:FecR domain-containing protein n=1 Tax=Butyrivibrio sp. WCE2006 TaxID=1410611 RepID=UPI0005D1B8DC|nr:FecR domain-containing protein [Butyrivibrio sp. WCE2006]
MRGVYDYTIYKAARAGRRILALLVALFIIIIFSGDEVVAETKNETENAMRLVGGTGTVNVIDYNGKKKQATSKMRLANGTTISTASDSSAYVNLDSAKHVKLDSLTRAEVRKRSGKYEVLLNSGNLFFNVTNPLEENEIFNIRTSNMTMSIRGTCAQVEVLDARHTRVCLLEGSLHCKITSLRSGESKTVILLAGQSADFYLNGKTENDCKIVTEDITKNDIKGFVLEEFYKDKTLANTVFQQSGLDFRSLTQAEVEDKLKTEQKSSNKSAKKKNDNKKKAMHMDFLEDHSEGKVLYTTEGYVKIIPEDVSVEQWRAHNIPNNDEQNQNQSAANTTPNQKGSHNQNNSNRSSNNEGDGIKTGSMKTEGINGANTEVKIQYQSPQAQTVIRNYLDRDQNH